MRKIIKSFILILSRWIISKLFLMVNFYIYFNQRIITLQYCDGFCHTSARISHRYTCVPPKLNVCMLIHSAMSTSLWPQRLQPVRIPFPWDSPGKNTGVGCRFLLPGIFPTQGLSPHLLCLFALAGSFFTTGPLGKPYNKFNSYYENSK